MFTRRFALILVVAFSLMTGLGADGGCGGALSPPEIQVQVVAKDTGLGVPNATITVQRGKNPSNSTTTTTDALGNASVTEIDHSPLTLGDYTVTVMADGYAFEKRTVTINSFSTSTTVISLTRNAPALVFQASTGSPPTPQPVTVTIVSQDGTQTLTENTIAIPNTSYAAVTFSNLPPSTTYNYTVSAPAGFVPVPITAVTTPSATDSPLYKEVDILLSPFTTLNFRTFSGSTDNPVAQPATVQVFLGNVQVFSDTTSAFGSQYAVVTVPNLLPNTTYTYTVAARGFQPVTDSAKTGANATNTPVDVLLQPYVLFLTSTVGFPSQKLSAAPANITVNPGNLSVLTISGPSTPAAVGTLVLQPNTTYTYDAIFVQLGELRGSFTTPTSLLPNPNNFSVPITFQVPDQFLQGKDVRQKPGPGPMSTPNPVGKPVKSLP